MAGALRGASLVEPDGGRLIRLREPVSAAYVATVAEVRTELAAPAVLDGTVAFAWGRCPRRTHS